jgi:hypothetical protein
MAEINGIITAGASIEGNITDGGSIKGEIDNSLSLALIQQLKEQVADLQNQLNNFIYPNAGAHNSIYRGKYLGDHVTDAQIEAIDAGTFEDLYIGDYWTINDIDWVIADFDYFYKSAGTYKIGNHHVVVIPRYFLYLAAMNNSDTTTSGYVGSKMHLENINSAREIVKSAFKDKIIVHKEILSNKISGGKIRGYGWYDVDVALMTEMMVFGTAIHAPQNAGNLETISYTTHKRQLSCFRFDTEISNISEGYFLRDVATDTRYIIVDGSGVASFYGIPTNELGVRPYFLLGKPQEEN